MIHNFFQNMMIRQILFLNYNNPTIPNPTLDKKKIINNKILLSDYTPVVIQYLTA